MNTVYTPDKSFGLKFLIDRERDKEILFNWDWGQDPAGLESRAHEKGISVEFALRLRDASQLKEVTPEIDNFIDTLHEERAEQVRSFVQDLTAFWGHNLELLTRVVTDITERSFYYPTYQVLVSACHMGMVSGGLTNNIGVGINLQPDWRNRILAHELVEEHWRKLFREEDLADKLGDRGSWALSEIGAVLILMDERLQPLWSMQQQELDRKGYFSQSNYPQLESLEARLRDQFSLRKSLDDFLESAVPTVLEHVPADLP